MTTSRGKIHRDIQAVDIEARSDGGHDAVLENGNRYELLVDMSYQRSLDQRKVEQIRKNWDPVAADPIVLSLRSYKKAAIVNGQHEMHAALLEGEECLLAEVFTGLTVSQEADLRLKKNNSRPDTALEKFYARIKAEEPTGGVATNIVAVLEEFGTKINRAPNKASGINCVGTVERIYERRNGTILKRTLLLLKSAYGVLAGPVVSSPLLEGAAWFLAAHENEYKWKKLVDQIQKDGPDGIYDRARGFKRAMGGSDWLNHYRAMVEIYNRAVRKPEDKLDLKTSRWSQEPEGPNALSRAA